MPQLGQARPKPARRTVTAGLVSPEQAHLWRGLTFLAPLWSGPAGAGVNPDIAGNNLSNNNGGAGASGPLGLGWRLSTTGASKFLRWPSRDKYHPVGDIGWTFFLAVDIASWANTSAGPIGAENSTTTDGFWRLSRANGGPDLSFVWRSGGANTSATWTNAWTNLANGGLGLHTFAVTRRQGGIYELFTDGKSAGTVTKTTPVPVLGTHDVTLGCTGSANTSSGVTGLYYLAAIWNRRALTGGDVRRLHADPFLVLRSGDDVRIAYDRYQPAGARLAPGTHM